MGYVIGIDIGTSGTKALLISENGDIVYRTFRDYPLYTPYPLWTEQDPLDWWDATVSVLSEIVERGLVDPSDIKAIGLSGQMHSLVLLDKNYNVIRPAILWSDQRTEKECRYVMELLGEDRIMNLISNPVLPGFTLGKILWVKNNEPENYEKIFKVLLPKDYIRFKMTGELFMEITDAAGTAYFSVKEKRWASELLDLLKIPPEFFPPVCKSYEVCGETTEELEKLTGIKRGTKVVGGGADNACGAVGAGIVVEGRMLSSIGTSGVILTPTRIHKFDPQGRIHTFNHSVEGMWYLMGVELSAGMSLRWYRETNGLTETAMAPYLGKDPYELLSEEASRAPLGSNGVIFLPYLSGERTPHKDPYARGVFFGISISTRREEMIRAIMEGVTFGLMDSVVIMEDLGVKIKEVRAIGGGARSPFWRKIQADVFGRELFVMEKDEGPAYGAAILAGVGAGMFRNIEEGVEALVKVKDVVEPDPENTKRYREFYQLYRSLYPALKDRFKELKEIEERYK